ncbi:hypothetical protein [Pseudomonas japonica]|uniref:Nucleotidyl transferase AbiEii toxin, Type IV TA system n=1 Tax=Pseudomonas japonica TaxID=256466 RepID=A0A239B793_9PSED|nr:hypothetical protein [Pseudomonas japonica]SNS03411.1 hypothetical protein SAMN05444352_102337 [Pseudomonas japonica]
MGGNALHNHELIELVADGLGETLRRELAFVGGCTTAMLVTDDAVMDDIRFTDDVDLVVELAGIADWHRLVERLAQRGFKITGEDEVNCRFRYHGTIVDVMPSDPAILGYANRWFIEGLAHAVTTTLARGQQIRIFQPAHFLASKLEAFTGRGNGDPYHKDVEDIVVLIDGRPELYQEIKQADSSLRQFIAAGIAELSRLEGITYAIQSSGSVRTNPGRGKLVHTRMNQLCHCHLD